MVLSDPAMMTAMVEAQKHTQQMGQVYAVFTEDQQLCCVTDNVLVLWVRPEMLSNYIPWLGGVCMLKSCVGMLMAGSGLEEVLKSAFGGVPHMLTGKNFPQYQSYQNDHTMLL